MTDWADDIDELRSEWDITHPGHPLHLLAEARVVLWFCPEKHPKGSGPTVEWETVNEKMVPHCLICGKTGAPR